MVSRIIQSSVLALVCLSLACKEKPAPTAPPLVEVKTIVAVQKDLPFFSEYVGETYGQQDIQIQSRVEGWITGIHFKEGDLVQKGQLLYTIDDLPIKNKIDQAEAKLTEAQTQRVKAKSDLDRVAPLTAMHALSERDLDAAKAAFQAAQSQESAAQAALRNARLELDYTRILSPITGIIGTTRLFVGDFVSRMSSGSPLNTVSSIQNMRVRFSISEDDYLRFKKAKLSGGYDALDPNHAVFLKLSDGSRYPTAGKIDLTNRQIDPATGSLLVQALFANPQALIKPGQYVKVSFQTDLFTNAILVPQQTVNQMQSIYTVFRLNDSNQVQPVMVKPGVRVGSNWVLQEGIKAGDRLAIVGSAVIQPGKVVKPQTLSWNYDSTLQQ